MGWGVKNRPNPKGQKLGGHRLNLANFSLTLMRQEKVWCFKKYSMWPTFDVWFLQYYFANVCAMHAYENACVNLIISTYHKNIIMR